MAKIKAHLLLPGPPAFTYIEATNTVCWVFDDGKRQPRCLSEPDFRKTIYAGMDLICEIDEARKKGVSRNTPTPINAPAKRPRGEGIPFTHG